MDERKLSRRVFIETIAVTAGAAAVGCETSPGVAPPDTGVGADGGLLEDAGRESSDAGNVPDDDAGQERCPPGDPSTMFALSVASGDPRVDSIVLWTRVTAPAGTDVPVRLELATDDCFRSLVSTTSSTVTARASQDHCVKVRITGLTAGTTYYYRFEREGVRSRVGRFKTAAAPSADVPVRFGLLSCQDFIGRWYNTLHALLDPAQDDLDFIVHVGDYVYETNGDPTFQTPTPERSIPFADLSNALTLQDLAQTWYAAQSLDNYRELYRAVRSDELLQRVHEKFAFINMWDDHEFSDDCWQDHGTYFVGKRDERDRQRRRDAEQAFLEYQPIARSFDSGAELAIDRLYPDNVIYRDFRFGRHVHLVMSDYRSYRPDHPIPEEAWPGTVVMTQAQCQTVLSRWETQGLLPAGFTAARAFTEWTQYFRPYVDLSEPRYADLQQALRVVLLAQYEADGYWAFPEDRTQRIVDEATAGRCDVVWINDTINTARDRLPPPYNMVPTIDPMDPGLERGMCYASMFKTWFSGSIGSRYFVYERSYQMYIDHLESSGWSSDVLGADQRAFITSAIDANQDATWKVFASGVSMVPITVNFGDAGPLLNGLLPPERVYMNVDQWDGFPREKERLLRDLLRPNNALILSGDIHASYATDHGADAMGRRAIEITCPGVSSANFRQLLRVSAILFLGSALTNVVDLLLGLLDSLVKGARPQIKHADSASNGVCLIRIDGSQMDAEFRTLPPAMATGSKMYDPASAAMLRWTTVRYRSIRQNGNNGELTRVTM